MMTRLFILVYLVLRTTSFTNKKIFSIKIDCDKYISSNSKSFNYKKKFDEIFNNIIANDPFILEKIKSLNKKKINITIEITFTEKIENTISSQKIILLIFKLENNYSSKTFYKNTKDLMSDLDKNDVFLRKGMIDFLITGLSQK